MIDTHKGFDFGDLISGEKLRSAFTSSIDSVGGKFTPGTLGRFFDARQCLAGHAAIVHNTGTCSVQMPAYEP